MADFSTAEHILKHLGNRFNQDAGRLWEDSSFPGDYGIKLSEGARNAIECAGPSTGVVIENGELTINAGAAGIALNVRTPFSIKVFD